MAVSMERHLEGYSDLRMLVDVNPPKFDFNQLHKGDNGHVVIQPKELVSEPGDRSRPVTKERGKTKISTRTSMKNSTQDEGEEERLAKEDTRKTIRAEPDVLEFDDEYDILDEDSWGNVPTNHTFGRFNQYRQITYKKVSDLESRIEETVAKTHRKIQTLKAQFQEHKRKWESEREALIQHIDQAVSLHEQAENEADAAMSQLSDFISEQEHLEKEEESRRTALSLTSRQSEASLKEAEKNLQEAMAEEAPPTPEREKTLMSQTDDAKADQLSRKSRSPDQMSKRSASFLDANSNAGNDEEATEIQGNTPEELARSSAQSRASLREQHRHALTSLKASAEVRRSRSPSILSIKDQKSVLVDAELDEDGDMPFPPDETKEEREARETKISLHDIGTSPMTIQREKTSDTLLSKKSVPMYEHPVVQEFLKAYDGVINFKHNLSQVFMDKDITSAGQILNDIEPVEVNRDDKIQPQLETITRQIYEITEECTNLINSIITSDRDYVVSSVANLSHDPTRMSMFATREPTAASTRGGAQSAQQQPPQSSRSVENQREILQLQEQYMSLHQQFEGEKKKYDDQLQHNTVLMMEMQDTINALQREISMIRTAPSGQKPQPTHTPPPDSPVMFTRLDSDRNSKVMKKAVNEKRLTVAKYQDAVDTMHEYNSLPAKRFVSLVHKYIHHHQMKEIEENVRKSNSMNNNVYQVLDKMETLQNDRAKRWADRMDEMATERARLAGMLMDTLEGIEKESGIFLIKPVYTYRAPYNPSKFKGKLSRPYQPNQDANRAISSLAPAPTPASNSRLYQQPSQPRDDVMSNMVAQSEAEMLIQMQQAHQNVDTGISGKATQLIGEYPRPVWMPTVAQSKPLEPGEEKMAIHNNINSLNTPRMLELDINRMLIGQNQVSAKIQPNFASNDRLANAANSNVRSYVTVNRNIGKSSHDDRPRSHTGMAESAAPPTTPLRVTPHSSAMGERRRSPSAGGDDHDRHQFPTTSPLPPIQSKDKTDLPIPPMSPPGSSLRQTPPAHNIHTPIPQVTTTADV